MKKSAKRRIEKRKKYYEVSEAQKIAIQQRSKIIQHNCGEIFRNDDWMWCLRCERFFQFKDLKRTLDEIITCPFDDCNSAGVGIDIFRWDDWYKQNPEELKHWPKSVNELYKGLFCPLYPEETNNKTKEEVVCEL